MFSLNLCECIAIVTHKINQYCSGQKVAVMQKSFKGILGLSGVYWTS